MTIPDTPAATKLLDAILAIAPTERPRDAYDFPDNCYDAYREGQKSILWTLATEIRKQPAPRAADADGRRSGGE